MITYYSKRWVEECRRRFNSLSPRPRLCRRLDGRFEFRLWDGPDGKDRKAIWEFDHGDCTSVEFTAWAAPWSQLRGAELDPGLVGRFSCAFALMERINKGLLSPRRALLSPGYRVEGRKLLMAWLLPAITVWAESNSAVECLYDFVASDGAGAAILSAERRDLQLGVQP